MHKNSIYFFIRKYAVDIRAMFSFIVIFSIFFARLFYPHLSVFYIPDLFISDLFHVNFSQKMYLSYVLKNNELPFITQYIGNGFPLLAESQIGAFNIINILLYRFLNPVVAFNLTYLLGFIYMSASLYFLGKLLFKKRSLAYVLSLSYSFSGIIMMQMSHQGILQATFLLPSILYFYIKSEINNNVKLTIIAGFIGGQQILFGHFFVALGTSISIVCIALLHLKLNSNRKQVLKVIKFLSIYFSICILISLPQLIQTLIFLGQTNRTAGVTIGSFDMRYFWTLLHPFIYGSLKNGNFFAKNSFNSLLWDSNLFIGYSILLLILTTRNISTSIQAVPKKIIVLLLLFIVLMLGDVPVLNFISYLPIISSFQHHSRFSIFTSLYLIIFLLYMIRKNTLLSRKKFSFMIFTFCISLQLISSFALFYDFHPIVNVEKLLSQPTATSKLPQTASFYSLDFARSYLDALLSHGYSDTSNYIALHESLYPFSNLIYKKKNCGLFLYSNFNLNVQQTIVRDVAKQYKGLNNSYINDFVKNNLGLLGCSQVISTRKISENSQKIDDSLYVTPVKPYVPLFKIFDKHVSLLSFDDGLKMIENNTYNLNTLYTLSSYTLESKRKLSSKIRKISNSNHSYVFSTDTNENAYLFLRVVFYPGWHAYIDGTESEITKANILYMSITIPKGHHTVSFIYRAPYWKTSVYITGLTYFFIAMVLIFYKPRPNK